MKRSHNNYTNNKSKHKMCWEVIVFCQGMSKLHHLQTVSYMIKIYCYNLSKYGYFARKYVEITSSTNSILYDKNLLL